MKLKRGDTVLVLAGKDKGKTGKIEKVLPKKNQIIVAGVNILKKHTRPTRKNPHGGVIEFNAPFSASNARLLCPKCSQPTRISYKKTQERKMRICQKCKEVIDE